MPAKTYGTVIAAMRNAQAKIDVTVGVSGVISENCTIIEPGIATAAIKHASHRCVESFSGASEARLR